MHRHGCSHQSITSHFTNPMQMQQPLDSLQSNITSWYEDYTAAPRSILALYIREWLRIGRSNSILDLYVGGWSPISIFIISIGLQDRGQVASDEGKGPAKRSIHLIYESSGAVSHWRQSGNGTEQRQQQPNKRRAMENPSKNPLTADCNLTLAKKSYNRPYNVRPQAVSTL